MAALADTKQMPQPLALTHAGEIGQLVTGFNRILQTWRQREEALRKSEQHLAITLNSIGDAVIATNVAGLITHMNPTAERLTGWALADALGQPLSDVFRIISAETRLPALNPVPGQPHCAARARRLRVPDCRQCCAHSQRGGPDCRGRTGV
jgi:PAS domain-containing protein